MREEKFARILAAIPEDKTLNGRRGYFDSGKSLFIIVRQASPFLDDLPKETRQDLMTGRLNGVPAILTPGSKLLANSVRPRSSTIRVWPVKASAWRRSFVDTVKDESDQQPLTRLLVLDQINGHISSVRLGARCDNK